MSGLTGYTVAGGQDLSGIFQTKTSGTNADTGYTITGGQDLSGIFQPLGTNEITSLTGYVVNNYNSGGLNLDLNKIFAPVSQYNGIWPYSNLNNKNTRQSINNGPPSSPLPTTLWSSPQSNIVPPAASAHPKFYNNKIVIGPTSIIYVVDSITGNLYALNGITGVLIYIYPSITSTTPTIGLNNILYFSNGNTVIALNNIDTSANLLWTYSPIQLTAPQIPIIGANQTIYVSTGNGYIFAINNDGTSKWFFLVLNSPLSNLAIGTDGTIYATTGSYIYAITDNVTYGSQKWSLLLTPTPSGILSYPSIGGNGTIYTRDNFHIYAINDDGTLKWSLDLTSSITPYPLTRAISISNNGTLYSCTNRAICSISDNVTYGSQNWIFVTNSSLTDISIGNDGGIYTTADYGVIIRISNSLISPYYNLDWAYQPSGGFSSPCSIGLNGIIYFSGDYGNILAIHYIYP